MIILSQRIRLNLNNTQRTWFERCAGAARFTWNLGLARWGEMYKAGERPSWCKLNAEVNARKAGNLAWLREIPWSVPNGALRNLGNAFSHFFRRVRAGTSTLGYPRFKKRGRCLESFAVEGRAIVFSGRKIKIPKLGWVRTRQERRFPGKVLSAQFTKHAGNWYVSVQIEIDKTIWSYPHRCKSQAVVGVDLGVCDLAVLSDGTKIEAPRALRAHERKLRRLNKELFRRAKGGANWKKTRIALARLHERIANIRKNVTHKLTARLVRNFRRIGVEDLCVKGMARTRLAKSVMDAAMAEVSRQLAYKAQLAGSEVVQADRWFPSTKMCSVCGVVGDKLPLSARKWSCKSCGTTHDRDVNAAINLKNLAAAHAVTAQCQGSSGLLRETKLPFGWESSGAVNLG